MSRASVGTDRFVVIRELGAGGMGAVYEVFDRTRKERVALKTLLRVDALGIHQFKREFRALTDVAHPNLVSLYELIADDERWFFTMELLEGCDFLSYVRGLSDAGSAHSSPYVSAATAFLLTEPASDADSRRSWRTRDELLIREGARPHMRLGDAAEARSALANPMPAAALPFDEQRLRSALRQLASGLSALHEAGRLHRDIKPSNVFVTHAHRVVLLDFGLAAEPDEEDDRTRVQLVGTPAYMSPEQFAEQRLTPASDWYAVGLMLYEALTGQIPFLTQGLWLQTALTRLSVEPPPPRELVPSAPPELSDLCVELLRVRPEMRPSGAEILRRLSADQLAADVLTTEPPPAPTAAAHASAAPSALSAPNAAPQLVGRARELALLHEAFERQQQHEAIVFIVHGCSGMGKSALVQHFLSELRQGAAPVILQGRCYQQESVPYKALDTSIEALVRHLRSLGEREASDLLPRDAWALARVFPAFRRVDALAVPSPQQATPDPRELRRRAFAALRELLARMSRAVRVVLHIDDLQWGDVESADLLAQVLRPQNAPPLVVLLCCRTEDLQSSPFMRALFGDNQGRPPLDVRELEVGPLSIADATQLGLAAQPRLDPAIAAAAARESGGSPLFMNELVRYVSEDGAARAFTQHVTIDQLLRHRFERLSEPAQRLLEVIAVASRPIAETVAGEAAGVADPLRDGLRELRLNYLIRTCTAGESVLIEAFHDRIREAVLGLLPPAQERAHHRRLARALEAANQGDAEMLAVHFAAADEREKASAYAARAADQAASALAFDRAVRLYQLALESARVDVAARHRLLIGLADALTNTGRALEAAKVYLAIAGTAGRDLACELRSRAAGQLLLSGHMDEGFATLGEVLDTLELSLPSTRRRTLFSVVVMRARLWLRGFAFERRTEAELPSDELLRIDTCWQMGLYLSSVEPLRGAYFQLINLLRALAAGEPFRIARSLSVEAGYASVSGPAMLPRARKLLASAQALADELAHPYLHGLVALAQGITAFMAEEDWLRAGAFCQRSEAIFRAQCRGVTWELTNSQFFKLNSLLMRGQLAALADQLPAALESAQSHGNLFAESFLRMRFSLAVRLAEDDPASFAQELETFARRLSAKDYYLQHYWRLAAEVNLELYAGRAEAAWNRIGQLWENLERSLILRMLFHRIDAVNLRARAALALAAQRSGPTRGSLLELVEADIVRLEAEKTMRALALAASLRAGIAALSGRRVEALELLGTAAARFQAADMHLHVNAALWSRGRLLEGDAGRALVAEAERFMTEQRVRAPARAAALLMPGFIKRADAEKYEIPGPRDDLRP